MNTLFLLVASLLVVSGIQVHDRVMVITKAQVVLIVGNIVASAAETSMYLAKRKFEEYCAVNARFLFLIDFSGSTMNHKNAYMTFVDKGIDYLHGVAENSEIAGNVDVGIVAFGICLVPPGVNDRDQKCLMKGNTKDYIIQRPFGEDWQSLKEEKTKFRALYESSVDGFTPTDVALNLAREMFKNETSGEIESQHMVAILLTDGAPSHYDHSTKQYKGFEFSSNKLKTAADRLKKDGFKLFTICLGSYSSEELMQNLSSPNMSFTIGNFSDNEAFDDAFSDIAKKVCARASVAPPAIHDDPVGTVAEQSGKKEHIGGTLLIIGVISAAFSAATLAVVIVGGIAMRRRWLKAGEADMVVETRDR